jgi:hypothetical protein
MKKGPGRPTLPICEKRSRTVTIRLNDSENAKWNSLKEKLGMSGPSLAIYLADKELDRLNLAEKEFEKLSTIT